MKWQVKYLGTEYGGDDEVQYHDPSKVQLALFDCKLVVQPSAAKKIHDGACKTVCAWIQCQEVQILPIDRIGKNLGDFSIRFNPHVNPNWVDPGNNNISGDKFDLIMTEDRSLFVVNGNHECTEE